MDLERKKVKSTIKKFLHSEAGISLLETMMALGVLSVIFSVLFSVFGNMSKSFYFDIKEIKMSQHVWEKIALCTQDIQKSDLVVVGAAGKQLMLFNSQTGDKTIYELKKAPSSGTALSSGNYIMVKRKNGSAGEVVVLRNVLPPPQSQFQLIQRAVGQPLALVKVAIQDKEIVIRKSAQTHPRGLL